MSTALSHDARRKLIGILGRLGSNHDGERSAAGFLADRLVKSHGLTWDDVVAVQRPAAAQPHVHHAGGVPTLWRVEAERCLNHRDMLSEWEKHFLADILRRSRLTPSQGNKLAQISRQLRDRGAW